METGLRFQGYSTLSSLHLAGKMPHRRRRRLSLKRDHLLNFLRDNDLMGAAPQKLRLGNGGNAARQCNIVVSVERWVRFL